MLELEEPSGWIKVPLYPEDSASSSSGSTEDALKAFVVQVGVGTGAVHRWYAGDTQLGLRW